MKTVIEHPLNPDATNEHTDGLAYDEVTFECTIAPKAKCVCLVGDFNSWDPNACPMVCHDGVFTTTLDLKSGEHRYMFVIDGEWYSDHPRELDGAPNEPVAMNSTRWL